MAVIKRLTKEEEKLKLALEKRVLMIYREIQKLENKKEENLKRIAHLEKQITNLVGVDILPH